MRKRVGTLLAALSAGHMLLMADIVNVQFYTPEIVRVTKTADGSSKPLGDSKVVIATPQNVKVAKSSKAGASLYKSSALTVAVDGSVGKVSFLLPTGELLLAEGSYSFTPIDEGLDKGAYKVMQSFALEPDEPIYGIGMLQNGKLSQRGERRTMQQSNLEDYAHCEISLSPLSIYL